MAKINIGNEPAVTYQLNVLASALGRFAPPDLDQETIQQASEMCGQAIESIQDSENPPVPHTNPVLLEEAVMFDEKLKKQMTAGPAKFFLPRSLLKKAIETVQQHADTCEDLRDGHAAEEFFIAPEEIATAYGLPDLWTEGSQTLQEEVDRWSLFTKHPEVPADLQRFVNKEDTANLMDVMSRYVVGVTHQPKVKTYITRFPERYHVYWAPLGTRLDYVTPANYDRATQLSFDMPHNATHLAHLNALDPGMGVFRYDDSMATRAFFEAVAVYSELRAVEEAQNNPDFVGELAETFNLQTMSQSELSQWILDDRGYEFKLRVARYAADLAMISGAGFEETIHEVADSVQISLSDAEKETRKYLAWTGLGAIYTYGYRRLETSHIEQVQQAITDDHGKAITSWQQFDTTYEN